MSNINARLTANLTRMLGRYGFPVTIQRRQVDATDDFTVNPVGWDDLATVKGVWDNPRRMWKGLNDGGAAVSAQRYMTIGYRDDLKDASAAVKLRVVVGGVYANVLAIAPIGFKVGLRLQLDVGTEVA